MRSLQRLVALAVFCVAAAVFTARGAQSVIEVVDSAGVRVAVDLSRLRQVADDVYAASAVAEGTVRFAIAMGVQQCRSGDRRMFVLTEDAAAMLGIVVPRDGSPEAKVADAICGAIAREHAYRLHDDSKRL